MASGSTTPSTVISAQPFESGNGTVYALAFTAKVGNDAIDVHGVESYSGSAETATANAGHCLDGESPRSEQILDGLCQPLGRDQHITAQQQVPDLVPIDLARVQPECDPSSRCDVGWKIEPAGLGFG
jgi:hypothetical protein